MKNFDYYKKVVFENYAEFNGIAKRAEFWYFVLFNMIISILVGIAGGILGDRSNYIDNIYSLAVFVPSIAVGSRRLHDIGKSGWWQLLCLLPVIGWIWLIVLYATDSIAGENKYGANNKEISKV